MNLSPCWRPSAFSAWSSRSPICGSRSRSDASNAWFDSLVKCPSRLNGPYRQNTPPRAQHARDAGEHQLHFRPAHDVRRVRAEDVVDCLDRPLAVAHVELQRRAQVRQRRFAHPQADAGEIRLAVRRLPLQMRQMRGEVHGVLPGAGADLQRDARLREPLAQYLEDRLAIALASLGMGLHGTRRKVVR